MAKSFAQIIDEMASDILQKMSGLPGAQSVQQIMSSMSQEMRDSLAIPLASEFQEFAAAATHQELLAAKTLRKAQIELTVHLNRVTLVSAQAPAELQTKFEGLAQIKGIAAQYGLEVEEQAWQNVFKIFLSGQLDEFYQGIRKVTGKAGPASLNSLGLLLPAPEAAQYSQAVEGEVFEEDQDGGDGANGPLPPLPRLDGLKPLRPNQLGGNNNGRQ